MYKEYEVVVASKDLNDVVLKGCKGTIVLVYTRPALGYEVEFFNSENETIGVLTVTPGEISKEHLDN